MASLPYLEPATLAVSIMFGRLHDLVRLPTLCRSTSSFVCYWLQVRVMSNTPSTRQPSDGNVQPLDGPVFCKDLQKIFCKDL